MDNLDVPVCSRTLIKQNARLESLCTNTVLTLDNCTCTVVGVGYNTVFLYQSSGINNKT